VKKTIAILISTVVVLIAMSAMAHNKVVVIPIGSSSSVAGTNGQVLYNDNGQTAGADVHYDKDSGKLEVAGEVRTVDGSGNSRLWGKGRPGSTLLTHLDPDMNGYCTTSTGIKHALSESLEIWGNADNGCPAGTWVCSEKELPTEGSCPIEPLDAYASLGCDGTNYFVSDATALHGWMAESGLTGAISAQQARARWSKDWAAIMVPDKCSLFRTWCCWN
jgi:hypothetical protein